MYLLNGTQFLFGPEKEEQGEGCERDLGFLFHKGAIQTLILGNTWCFLWLGTPDAMQWYQLGWSSRGRGAAFCLTATLNIHPQRQIICWLLNYLMKLSENQIKCMHELIAEFFWLVFVNAIPAEFNSRGPAGSTHHPLVQDHERGGEQWIRGLNMLKFFTHLIASLAMAAKQWKVGTCGVVLWSIIIKTFWLYPWATYLPGGE